MKEIKDFLEQNRARRQLKLKGRNSSRYQCPEAACGDTVYDFMSFLVDSAGSFLYGMVEGKYKSTKIVSVPFWYGTRIVWVLKKRYSKQKYSAPKTKCTLSLSWKVYRLFTLLLHGSARNHLYLRINPSS